VELSIALLVLTASAVGGGIRRLGGFGGALIMSPVLMWVFPVTTLVILVMLAEFLGGLWLSRHWKVDAMDLPRRNRLLGFSVVAIPVGMGLGTMVPIDGLRFATNVVVAAFSIYLFFSIHHQFQLSKGRDRAVGLLCGGLLGSCGIGGPPAVIYLNFSELEFNRARSLLSNFISGISISGVLIASVVVRDLSWLIWLPLVLGGYGVGLWAGGSVAERYADNAKMIKKICLLVLIVNAFVNMSIVIARLV
jgi:uncharacterized membrane protein YfcA